MRRLDTYRQALDFDPIPIDESVAESWAHLRVLLRDAGAPRWRSACRSSRKMPTTWSSVIRL